MKPTDYVTSDHHFGHAAVIEYSKRPFTNVEEMDRELIARWNAKVPKGATVYHLGDFCFGKQERIRELVGLLNGRICLVLGNHDRGIRDKAALQSLFQWVKPYYESKTADGRKIVMCHYPFLTWNRSHHGSWHLHGHSHGSLRAKYSGVGGVRIDVGVDKTEDYEPLSFGEVAERAQRLSCLVAVDHHE